MKIELNSPRGLLATGLVTPLSEPACFICPKGTVICENDAWTASQRESGTFIGPRPLSLCITPHQRAAFHRFLSSKGKQHAFNGAIENDRFWLTAVTGTSQWDSGYLVLRVPNQKTKEQQNLELRMTQLIEGDEHGLWDVSLSDEDLYYSQGWFQLRGLDPKSRCSDQRDEWLDRVHPSDRETVRARRDALIDGPRDELFDEYRERHADGYWIWILCRSRVVERDHQGKATRLIGTDTNITHLKLREGQFDDLNTRLQLALSASGIGIWEFDMATNSVTWDQNTRKIYGVEDARLTLPDDFWISYVHPNDRDWVLEETRRKLETLSDYDLGFRIIHPRDGVRHVHTKATFTPQPDGTHLLIGVVWDNTHAAKQSAELETAYALVKKHNLALKEAHAEMEHRSSHDVLTGLPNRRKLQDFQNAARANAKGPGTRCALLHLDLDRFKRINDTLGHSAGDAVLQHAATLLRASCPPDSIVARIGGDEFAVFMVNAPCDADISDWALTLIQNAKAPILIEGQSCRFGLSIGVAIGDCTDNDDERLYANADLALYQSKNDGRGTVRFYADALGAAAVARRHCSDDILDALEKGHFGCVYQPQFAIDGKTITGLEALARWRHPTRGMLTPDVFIEVGDDIGVIAKIDQIVLDAAIRDADAWAAAGRKVPQLSVNVSGRRLLDAALPAQIDYLANCPHKLAFELLETVFLDESQPHLEDNLACIRELGISIELDDFGTGHASVAALLHLQPDRLKIDKQLVIPIATNQQQRNLVKSIIDIGRVLNVSVVAEGVETQTHIDILRDLGCNYLQGFGLCRPSPADHILNLLPSR